MGTLLTPYYQFPWPDGSERVMDGDNAMGALAQAVEDTLRTVISGFSIARLSVNQTITTTSTAVQNTTISFTSPVWEFALCFATFDISQTVAAGASLGRIAVDTVERPGEAHFAPAGVERSTVPYIALSDMLGPGAHNIRLNVLKTGSGTQILVAQNTSLLIARFRAP